MLVQSVHLALLGATVALAAPAPEKRATCTFSGSSGYSEISSNKKSCSTITIDALEVPAGDTLDLTDLTSGTKVVFTGTTTFAYKEWSGPLVSISGTDITVNGGGTLDGNGADYWDGEGSNGGKTKPKFFAAHSLDSSTISDITILNAPVQVFSIESTDLTISDVTINNKAGDSKGANTDGFDIGSSSGIKISGATVYNQDDCVAINSGSDITFSGGYCSGGHGLSIGSVGGRSDNTVSGVTFSSSQIVDSQNGVRIKTISGDTGTVEDVTYSGITLSGITDYGIIVNQAYDGTSGDPTNGVKITSFDLSDVTGSVSSDATEIYIECGSGSCTDWKWSGVSITGGKTSSKCLNVPSGISCT